MESKTLSILINTLSRSMWNCSVVSDKMEVLWGSLKEDLHSIDAERIMLFTKDGSSCTLPINEECYGILSIHESLTAFIISPVYETETDTAPCGYVLREIEFSELLGGKLISDRNLEMSRRHTFDIVANVTALRNILERMEMYTECGYTEAALKSCERLMGSMTNSMQIERYFSGSGKKMISDASAFVKMVCEICKFRLGEKAEINMDIQQGILLCADYDKFSSVLVNLIVNAYIYNLSETKIITVSLKTQDGDVVLTVDDNGQGMSEELAKFSFDLFLEEKPKSNSEGLGLVVVRMFAESCGGSVKMISKGIGKGTTVRLTFPVNEETDGFFRSSTADYIENKWSTIYYTLSKADM